MTQETSISIMDDNGFSKPTDVTEEKNTWYTVRPVSV